MSELLAYKIAYGFISFVVILFTLFYFWGPKI